MKTNAHNSNIRRLRKQVLKSLDWGPPKTWHSSMFDELSAEILAKTQISLSAATLKRFFEVINHSGTPSTSTLDALSRFVGYQNWRVFKTSEVSTFNKLARKTPNVFFVALGFAMALVTVLLISNQQPGIPKSPETLTFSSRPLTQDFPNSVVFDFNLDGVESDKIHIQQYWDPSKTITIKPNQKQATGIYYFPGYFKAQLLIDDHVLKQHDLFLKSDGWLGLVEHEPVPKYFSPIENADMTLTYPEELEVEITRSDDPLVMGYHFIEDLGNVSGDLFNLSTTIQNTYAEKWAICQSTQIYLIGTDGAMIIPLAKVGCSANNNLMLNDLYLSGKDHDLSAFGIDLSTPVDIRILNENQSMKFFINNKEVYSAKYTASMGRLVGLRFKFMGLGKVHSLNIHDQNMEAVTL